MLHNLPLVVPMGRAALGSDVIWAGRSIRADESAHLTRLQRSKHHLYIFRKHHFIANLGFLRKRRVLLNLTTLFRLVLQGFRKLCCHIVGQSASNHTFTLLFCGLQGHVLDLVLRPPAQLGVTATAKSTLVDGSNFLAPQLIEHLLEVSHCHGAAKILLNYVALLGAQLNPNRPDLLTTATASASSSSSRWSDHQTPSCICGYSHLGHMFFTIHLKSQPPFTMDICNGLV
mmetsp:Transcript_82882/g.221479  ORF Transcript_82882/g.221479 Transcript_82882/m.221479 type:complete len:230 (+) Transcript_82882:530-1219(+)